VSGSIAPKAAVRLSSDSVNAQTFADGTGRFFFSGVVIPRGFTDFCLESLDIHGGISTACFTLPHALGNIRMENLFLPPTVMLASGEIAEGSAFSISGQTMPNSIVTIQLNGKDKVQLPADANGNYRYAIQNLKQGTFRITADALYKGRASIRPASAQSV